MLLQNNLISYLPYELGTTKRLKYIQLSGNPIIYPEKSMIKLGTESLLKYLHLQNEQNDSSKTVLCEDQLIDVSWKQFENIDNFNNEKPVDRQKKDGFLNSQKNSSQKCSFQKNCSIPLPNARHTEKPLKLPEHFNSNKYVIENNVKSNEDHVKLIEDQFIRDIWLEERKEILSRREKIIQDRK